VVQDQHQAAAGGIFRDHSGSRLACFAANLGNCTIMRAELRAASIRFKIAWELGYRKVHLQMDSLAAVEALCADTNTDVDIGPRTGQWSKINIRQRQVASSEITRGADWRVSRLTSVTIPLCV
ncbi:hypothetical protein LINPERHAP1_LOCUS8681, partial [Linum perenne]